MSRELEWTGQTAFAEQPLREWAVDGEVAGITRGAKGFTFATIDGAGHMVRSIPVYKASVETLTCVQVPMDKPKVALDLLQKWLSGEEL